MTVTRIGTAGEEPMVWCAWFDGTKDAYALFPPDALKASALSEPAEAAKALFEPEPKTTPEPQPQPQPKTEPEPQQEKLIEQNKSPPQPQPRTEADTASAFTKMDSFRWAFSEPKPLPSEADSAPITNSAAPVAPEAIEAKRDSHPTQADDEPRTEKKESLEDQIMSMQSLISDWLKRR